MSIIVAGHIIISDGARDTFITLSEVAVKAARKTQGCADFAVSPDPIDPNRVNIFERWHSEKELLQFRASGPDTDMNDLIEDANVRQFEVNE